MITQLQLLHKCSRKHIENALPGTLQPATHLSTLHTVTQPTTGQAISLAEQEGINMFGLTFAGYSLSSLSHEKDEGHKENLDLKPTERQQFVTNYE
jgi:hypothetical protein